MTTAITRDVTGVSANLNGVCYGDHRFVVVGDNGTLLTSYFNPATPPTPPVLSSPMFASATVGLPFSYTISPLGTATHFNASGLPPGLSVNSSSGVISGVPTSPGVSTVTVTAANAGGVGSNILTLNIAESRPLPAITSSSTASGSVCSPFSFSITANNSPTNYAAAGLPSGLSLNPTTGAISGTPLAAGSFIVNLAVQNAAGTTTGTLTLNIGSCPPAVPVITSATTLTGALGAPFSYQITATQNPTVYGASGLPGGLSVNPVTGLISGVPTASGLFAVTLSAANAGGTGTQLATLAITSPVPPVPEITSATNVAAVPNRPFQYQIIATANPASYAAWGLPDWLTLNPQTGLLSGTPLQTNTYQITVSAANAGGAGSATLYLAILPPVAPSVTSHPAAQTVAVGSNVTFTVTGTGTEPLSYFWLRNGTPIPGATGSSYTLRSAQLSDSGAGFSCLISNLAGTDLSQTAVLTVIPAPVLFTNSTRIVINEGGPATPYPSSITVTGQSGRIRKATVTLHSLVHTWPEDVCVLLVGPQGQKIILVAQAGGDHPVTSVNLTFDDDAPSALTSAQIVSGTFRPSDRGLSEDFPAPAPARPYGTSLSALRTNDPNGTWSLYVWDTFEGEGGSIANGWSLTLVLDPPPVIVRHPEGQIVLGGSSTHFSVAAEGVGPLSYRWQMNGADLLDVGRISGAGTPNLTITNVQTSDQGTYTVIVSNAGGPVTSLPASLTVLPAWTSYFAAIRASTNGYQLTMGGAPGTNYEIQVSTDLKTWRRHGTLLMTNTTSEYLDSTTGLAKRFYRAKLLP